MPGGENQLVKAKLKPLDYTVNMFKRDIQRFVAGHRGCFNRFAKKDNPYIGKVLGNENNEYHRITKESVIESLELLSKIIIPDQAWFQSDDVALLCARLFDHNPDDSAPNKQDIKDYTTYSTELQNLLSTLEKCFNTSVANTIDKKLENIESNMWDMYYDALPKAKRDHIVLVTDTITKYFDSALSLASIFRGAIRVCKAMGMIS